MVHSNRNVQERIAKNTLALYVRSLISLAITLYTSRIILYSIGVEDFGIYTVVAGMVGMLSLFTGTISNAVSRFFAFSIGSGGDEEVSAIYTVSINIILMTILVIFILGETLGGYFLNNGLNIPAGRLNAANWILQATIISFAVSSLNIPNIAAIIAYEKMTFFAYMGIFDAVSKLLIVYLLSTVTFDKLVFYAILLCLQQIVVSLCYYIYIWKNFIQCRYTFSLNLPVFKQLFAFIGWTFLSAFAFITKNQGVDILLNLYFGPIVNAVKGIAAQVQNAVISFGVNFLTAVAPQITKSYAQADYPVMMALIGRSVRFAFYLLLIIMLPVGLNIDYILNLWLVDVPEQTNRFVVLILILSICDICSLPLHNGIQASGKIRNYQMFSAFIQWGNLPFSYLALYKGADAYVVLYVAIFFSILLFGLRLFFLKRRVPFTYGFFLKGVLLHLVVVATTAMVINYLLHYTVVSFIDFVLSIIVITCINIIVIGLLGLKQPERIFIFNKINSYVYKKNQQGL